VKLGVIGSGAWGTALAQTAAAGGEDVVLWARNSALAKTMQVSRVNADYLPGITLSPLIHVTSSLDDLSACDLILCVTPAQYMRHVLTQAPIRQRALVLCSKGIEADTGLLMSEVATQACPEAQIAVLSGPTFAHEVAAGLPTAITLACENTMLARDLATRLARPFFRPYVSGDVIGAEIGGAVKNVLAIACGVVEGRTLGQNARAALIARGFAEMTRFGLAKGAQAETLAGLAGFGDLVLTCSSTASRNFAVGLGLGQGQSITEVLAGRKTVAEGVATAPVLQSAARQVGVDMPVVDAVCALIAGQASVDHVMGALLSRPLRGEGETAI
jgi:glycerol-3-phosphate dehydrogenase (NAD(P)+)